MSLANDQEANAAVPESGNSGLVAEIEKLRRNLLDIGTRNRLISAPLKSSRANVLEIIDDKADEVFSALCGQCATIGFAANETPLPSESAGYENQEGGIGPVYV